MENFELNDFNKRIGLNTDLKNISQKICESYNLGEFISNELITIGYEDYNYYLTTNKKKFCVKIFSKYRSKEDINNYLNRIRVVANSDVNAPKPLILNDDIVYSLEYENNHYDICVFEYINGKNYFEIDIKPKIEEIKELAKQTALINNIEIKPKFIYDSWAIINFEEEYKNKRNFLSDEYKIKFDDLLVELKKINIEKLPKAFVHGDIINTNVMKDEKSKIWIIDFAVSNYLPRIIDLAVISCNLCLDETSVENTLKNIRTLLTEYNNYNKLTQYELETFWTFYKLANAMYILQPIFISKTEEDSEENEYWLNEGKIGYSYSGDLEKEIIFY